MSRVPLEYGGDIVGNFKSAGAPYFCGPTEYARYTTRPAQLANGVYRDFSFPDPATIDDGDVFSVSLYRYDLHNSYGNLKPQFVSVIFEMDKTGDGVDPANVEVDISAAADATDVRNAVLLALVARWPGFGVVAFKPQSTAQIRCYWRGPHVYGAMNSGDFTIGQSGYARCEAAQVHPRLGAIAGLVPFNRMAAAKSPALGLSDYADPAGSFI